MAHAVGFGLRQLDAGDAVGELGVRLVRVDAEGQLDAAAPCGAAVLGLAAGLKGMLVTLVVASLGAAIYGIAYRKIKKTDKISIAFVPFMLAGYVIALLAGFC